MPGSNPARYPNAKRPPKRDPLPQRMGHMSNCRLAGPLSGVVYLLCSVQCRVSCAWPFRMCGRAPWPPGPFPPCREARHKTRHSRTGGNTLYGCHCGCCCRHTRRGAQPGPWPGLSPAAVDGCCAPENEDSAVEVWLGRPPVRSLPPPQKKDRAIGVLAHGRSA